MSRTTPSLSPGRLEERLSISPHARYTTFSVKDTTKIVRNNIFDIVLHLLLRFGLLLRIDEAENERSGKRLAVGIDDYCLLLPCDCFCWVAHGVGDGREVGVDRGLIRIEFERVLQMAAGILVPRESATGQLRLLKTMSSYPPPNPNKLTPCDFWLLES